MTSNSKETTLRGRRDGTWDRLRPRSSDPKLQEPGTFMRSCLEVLAKVRNEAIEAPRWA